MWAALTFATGIAVVALLVRLVGGQGTGEALARSLIIGGAVLALGVAVALVLPTTEADDADDGG